MEEDEQPDYKITIIVKLTPYGMWGKSYTVGPIGEELEKVV